jgi:hypothetical protein
MVEYPLWRENGLTDERCYHKCEKNVDSAASKEAARDEI